MKQLSMVYQFQSIEIWQLPPIDIDIDEVAAGVAEVAVAPMAMVEVISLISIVALQTLDR